MMPRPLLPGLSALLLWAAAGMAVSLPAQAAEPLAHERKIHFDFPAQPLDAALAGYFRLTGVQLLYDSSLSAGLKAPAIRGIFTPREALRRLLAGTGLTVRYSQNNAAIIVAAGSDAAPAPQMLLGRVVVRERARPAALSPLARLAYYATLEEELRRHVQADPDARRRRLTATLALDIDNAGTITGVRILRSSGSTGTDALLHAALAGRTVSPPPAGLVQPLAIRLTGQRP